MLFYKVFSKGWQMRNVYPESYYIVDGLNKALALCLETAFVVLEKTRGLSYDDQVCILNGIKSIGAFHLAIIVNIFSFRFHGILHGVRPQGHLRGIV